jgi:hypothetical protein
MRLFRNRITRGKKRKAAATSSRTVLTGVPISGLADKNGLTKSIVRPQSHEEKPHDLSFAECLILRQ